MRFLRWFPPSISASWETVLVSFAQVIGGVQRSRSMSVMYLFAHRRRRQKAGAFSCFFFVSFSLFFTGMREPGATGGAPVVVVVRILFGRGHPSGNFQRDRVSISCIAWMVKAKRSEAKLATSQRFPGVSDPACMPGCVYYLLVLALLHPADWIITSCVMMGQSCFFVPC